MFVIARVGIVTLALLLTVTPAAVAQGTDSAAGAQVVRHRSLPFTTQPLLVEDGRIFVFSGGIASALDARTTFEAATGRRVWRESVADLPAPLAPSQVGSDGTLALRTQSAALKLDAETGAIRWQLPSPEFPPRPLVFGARVYVTFGTGTVSGIDASSGAVVWSRDLGELPTSEGLTALAGTLFVTTLDGTMIALDPSTGALLWSRDVGRTLAPPVLGDGGPYVGTLARDLYLIDPGTGAVRSQLSLGGAILFSPVSTGDTVYVATDNDQGTTVLAVDGL
jgi:outer membrane protein assembly factor BamB